MTKSKHDNKIHVKYLFKTSFVIKKKCPFNIKFSFKLFFVSQIMLTI